MKNIKYFYNCWVNNNLNKSEYKTLKSLLIDYQANGGKKQCHGFITKEENNISYVRCWNGKKYEWIYDKTL